MNGHKAPGKQFALVVWHDAHGDATSELADEEITHEASAFYSYGWILRSDEKGVSLAAEWSPSTNKYRGHMFIPRGMVAEELNITLSKKAQKRARKAAVAESIPATAAIPVSEGNKPDGVPA